MLFGCSENEKKIHNIMFLAIGSDFITNKKLSTLMNKHIKLQPKLTEKRRFFLAVENENGKKATKQMEN